MFILGHFLKNLKYAEIYTGILFYSYFEILSIAFTFLFDDKNPCLNVIQNIIFLIDPFYKVYGQYNPEEYES